jgi:hypothetical protein
MKTFIAALAIAGVLATPTLAQEYRVVDTADVRVSPNKFKGKNIELRGMNCYYSDDDDYRCTDGTVTVFAKAATSESNWLEKNCDTMKKFMSAQCKATVRFSYDEVTEDLLSGYKTRTILQTDTVTVIRSSASSSRSRR